MKTMPSQICEPVLPICNLEKGTNKYLQSHPIRQFHESENKNQQGKNERSVRFIRSLCHLESWSTRKGFQPDIWKEYIIHGVYEDTLEYGLRHIKKVFALIPQSDRKTTPGTAVSLLHSGQARIPYGQTISALHTHQFASNSRI